MENTSKNRTIDSTFKVVIKKTMMQKAGTAYFQQAAAGTEIPVNIVFQKNQAGNMVALADGVEIANVLTDVKAFVAEVTPENYQARITGVTGNPNEMEVTVSVYAFAKKTAAKGADAMSAFESDIKRIVDEGIMPEATVCENITVMAENRFPEEMIHQVLATYTNIYAAPAHTPKVLYKDPNPKGQSKLAQICLNALCGCAIILDGDKSTGKNVAAETIAKVLGRPYYCITGDRKMNADAIFGTKSTDNSAFGMLSTDLALAELRVKQGIGSEEDMQKAAQFELLKAKCSSVNIVQEVSAFVEWAEFGGVLNFNEINLCDSNFLASLLNPVTDDTGFLNVPGRGKIVINPNCVLIGTQNSGAEYKGVNQQNAATMSRFGLIKFDAPKSIKNILKANFEKGQVPEEMYESCEKFYNYVLKAAQDGSISNASLNIRGMVRAIRTTIKVPGFTNLKSQLIEHVVNTCPAGEIGTLTMQINDLVA